jgi:hypothetical protein
LLAWHRWHTHDQPIPCIAAAQVHAAYGLAVSSSLVACACSAGVVRMFATRTLQFKCNLPRPSPTLAAAQRTGAYGSPAGPLGSGSPGMRSTLGTADRLSKG